MIKSLTSLRGIFIIFIFLHHCRQFYIGGGTMAVTFFFVLGGFSMALGYKDRIMQSDFCYKTYLIRRCIKFYPLHWLCLLASLPLISFSMAKIPIFFINASLLQTMVPVKGIYFSFNMVSWYLANTMIFAVVFPYIFNRIMQASPLNRGIIVFISAVFYAVVALFLPSKWYHAILYVSPIMRLFDFVFGIFLAIAYWKIKEKEDHIALNSILSQFLIFLIIVLLVVESCILSENIQMIAPVYWPFVGLLILIASLSGTSAVGGGKLIEYKCLQRLGELSFVIFLTHQLVVRYSKLLLDNIHFFDNNIAFIAFTLTLTLIVSIVVEKYILKPITQWLTKRIQPSMTARS